MPLFVVAYVRVVTEEKKQDSILTCTQSTLFLYPEGIKGCVNVVYVSSDRTRFKACTTAGDRVIFKRSWDILECISQKRCHVWVPVDEKDPEILHQVPQEIANCYCGGKRSLFINTQEEEYRVFWKNFEPLRSSLSE